MSVRVTLECASVKTQFTAISADGPSSEIAERIVRMVHEVFCTCGLRIVERIFEEERGAVVNGSGRA